MSLLNKVSQFWNNPDKRTRRVNRNVVYSFGVKGAGILVSLMMVPLTLNYLSRYEYGIWLTILSVLNWINYFDMGLGNGLRNKLAVSIAKEDMNKARIYVSSTFALLSLISVVLCIVALIISKFVDWNSFLNVNQSVENLRTVIEIVLVCICVNFVLKTIGIIHVSFQNAWINNLLTFLGSLVAFIWVFILYKTTPPSLLNVAIAVSTSPLIVYILSWPITFRYQYKELSPKISAVRVKEALSLGGLGIKFFLLQFACLVIFSTSNIIISKVFTPADVTPYNIAYKYFNVLSMVYMIIINPLWTAITDAYTRKDYKWISISMKKMIRIWMLSVGALAVMVLLSKIIFRLWIGDTLDIPYGLSIAVAIYMAIFMWTNLFSSYVNGVSHVGTAIYTMLAAAAIFIPLAVFMSRIFGIVGIPYAMGAVLMIPGVALAMQYRKEIIKNI